MNDCSPQSQSFLTIFHKIDKPQPFRQYQNTERSEIVRLNMSQTQWWKLPYCISFLQHSCEQFITVINPFTLTLSRPNTMDGRVHSSLKGLRSTKMMLVYRLMATGSSNSFSDGSISSPILSDFFLCDVIRKHIPAIRKNTKQNHERTKEYPNVWWAPSGILSGKWLSAYSTRRMNTSFSTRRQAAAICNTNVY